MYHKISCSIHNSVCKVNLPLKLVVELTKGNCYYTNASFFFANDQATLLAIGQASLVAYVSSADKA